MAKINVLMLPFACKAGGVHFCRDYRSPPNAFSSTVSPYTCSEFTRNAKYSNWGTHTLYKCRKLSHCNFTRLDLSETAQLIGGGKKIGNSLTCKRGQRRTMRERKEFNRTSFSRHKIKAQKNAQCRKRWNVNVPMWVDVWRHNCWALQEEGERRWVRGRAYEKSLAEGG